MKIKKWIYYFLLSLFLTHSVSVFGYEISKIDPDSLVRRLQDEGKQAGKRGDYDFALEKFTKAYQIREQVYGKMSIKLAPPLINLGITYKNLGYIDKAIEAYKMVESLCSIYPTENNMLGLVYVNLGVIYSESGDYLQALQYQRNAFRMLQKDSIKNPTNYQISKYNIAETQFKLGFYSETIKFSSQNLKSLSPELRPRLYDLIAQAYLKQGQTDLSEENYLKAIAEWIKLLGPGNVELVSEYLAYADLLRYQKQFDRSLVYIQKANRIVLDFYKEKSTPYSEVLTGFGDYYNLRNLEAGLIDDFREKRKESLNQAIQFYQKAIVALVDSFQVFDPLVNPPLKNVISDIYLVEVVKKKASALEKLADIFRSEFDAKNAEKYYAASLNSLEAAIDLIHRLQIGYENEDSKLFLSQNQQTTFCEAVEVSYKLFSITKDKKYIDQAFIFSEKSKSSNLLASMKDVKAKEFGGIPDSLLKKENDYKGSIASYKSKLIEETNSEKPDSQKINIYSSKIFKLDEEYHQLISSFEKAYPQYYALKYESNVAQISQVQSKLGARQAFIEYYLKEPEDKLSNGEIYTFTITCDSVSLTRESIDQSFLNKIQTFHDFLINPGYLDTKKKDYLDYSFAAYSLYEKLIQPIANKLSGKSLTIVPHDKLAYIPFDALLTEMPDTTTMNFRNLKYLIRDYAINYGYSATLLFDFSNQKKRATKKLLIFSPEYNSSEPRKDHETGISYSLNPLPGAKDEIKAISNFISSVAYSDEEAQEGIFKTKAGDFDVLHLAMHTIINDSLPMLSKLVFSKPKGKTDEDGCLNAFEVYNMKLNARLAVLSACETGSGKLQGGEGVMSMARGFIYAGCPSVVMTLWQVEDKSGVNIMSDFYRFLSKGKRKDVALRMAKLNHLEKSDPLTAHPHFWLGYVNIGNPDPLYTSKDIYFIIFLVVAVLLIFADFYFRRKRKR